MRHLKNCYDYFSIEPDGRLCRNIEFTHKDYDNLLFYKEYVDGTAQCRNLYKSWFGGYLIAVPGEVYSRYCSDVAQLEDWGDCDKIDTLGSEFVSEADKTTIEMVYPEFRYVLKKWERPTKQLVMSVLPIWQEHRETEMLLAGGLENLVLNKSFWKLSKAKRTELHLWLKNNKTYDVKILKLKDLQAIIKYKISYEQWQSYKKAETSCYHKMPYTLFSYLSTQEGNISELFRLYEDYIRLVKQTEHNLKDSYWKYPKDLRLFHNRTLEEVGQIKINRDKSKFEKMQKVIKQYLKYNDTIEGYCIYFSFDSKEWNNQANILHQCIVRCDYMQKVVNRNCLLAFIQKDGIPVATAEILPGKKIGQFYTDEHLPNYYPSKELKDIFDKWLERLPDNILRERKKKIA